jgi:hypothetical protein
VEAVLDAEVPGAQAQGGAGGRVLQAPLAGREQALDLGSGVSDDLKLHFALHPQRRALGLCPDPQGAGSGSIDRDARRHPAGGRPEHLHLGRPALAEVHRAGVGEQEGGGAASGAQVLELGGQRRLKTDA